MAAPTQTTIFPFIMDALPGGTFMRLFFLALVAIPLVLAPVFTKPADNDEPKPVEKKKLRVVVFGGHPDDPESGCGGLIALLRKDGHEVIAAYATPAIVEGRIYLRTAGHLYCFGIAKKK
jgi:hypothetical protein